MLVLSRRTGESVVIGDDITVTVLEVRGDVVRIGIDAPRSVAVNRAELLAEVANTNQAASSPAEASTISTLKARRSAQRRYIRKRISAQSWSRCRRRRRGR